MLNADNKTICSYFWTSLCVRPLGRLTPCCAFQSDLPAAQYQPGLVDLETSFNDPFFQELRTNALQGKENKGCEECYIRERDQGRSLRLRANKEGIEHLSSPVSRLDQVTYIELFIGNRCNLKCVMCAPELSSALAFDYVKLGLFDEKRAMPYENSYLDIVPRLKNLRRIKFVGGEPLMHKTHWELLESIPLDQARQMTIEYATNCTFFPNETQINLWNKFSDIEIYLSIDGFGSVNEYIRFPSQWERVDKNAKLFKQYLDENPKNLLGVNTVVSLYNIFDLHDIVRWVKVDLFQKAENSEPNHLLARLDSPNHMAIRHLPEERKKELLSQYPDTSLYGFIRGYLQTPGDVGVLDEWRKSVQQFDALRKIHWRDYIPKMAALFE